MWQHYLNAVLGLAVLIAAFMGLTGVALSWTFGILGALILIVGLWGGASRPSHESQELQHKHA